MEKNPGITGMLSNADTRARIAFFVTRSRIQTATARAKGMKRVIAGSRQLAEHFLDGRRAGRAGGRVFGVGADVGGVLPAALALLAFGALYAHSDAGRAVPDAHLRND